MNRIKLGVIACVLALLGALFTTPPAQAARVTPNNCLSYANVTACVQVQFRTQADGTGVSLEGYYKDTTNGCSDLNSPAWKVEQAIWANPRTGGIQHTYQMGDEPCNDWNNLDDRAGTDTGCYDFRWVSTANRHNAADRRFYMGWTLCPDGSSTLNYEFTLAP